MGWMGRYACANTWYYNGEKGNEKRDKTGKKGDETRGETTAHAHTRLPRPRMLYEEQIPPAPAPAQPPLCPGVRERAMNTKTQRKAREMKAEKENSMEKGKEGRKRTHAPNQRTANTHIRICAYARHEHARGKAPASQAKPSAG
ncbi:hypothetical protein K438DRAFT_1787267 [Mycena galopus ATCC 62051]|nr:hypothetical protein K438DRAFT_1787267 [Mycena galopus ATCC 62051]